MAMPPHSAAGGSFSLLPRNRHSLPFDIPWGCKGPYHRQSFSLLSFTPTILASLRDANESSRLLPVVVPPLPPGTTTGYLLTSLWDVPSLRLAATGKPR